MSDDIGVYREQLKDMSKEELLAELADLLGRMERLLGAE